LILTTEIIEEEKEETTFTLFKKEVKIISEENIQGLDELKIFKDDETCLKYSYLRKKVILIAADQFHS
jgi:hypothetical protein